MKTHWGRIAGRLLVAFLALGLSLGASAEEARFQAGMTQVEFRDPADKTRPIDFLLVYPAAPDGPHRRLRNLLTAPRQACGCFADAPAAGAGSGHWSCFLMAPAATLGYAWFGEYLAERGYLVAMVYHYRANTFDSERALCAQSHVAAAARLSLDHLDVLRTGLGLAHRCRAHRRGRPFAGRVHRALARRGRSRPAQFVAYQTRMEGQLSCPPTCASRWSLDAASAQGCATPGSRRPSRWRPAT